MIKNNMNENNTTTFAFLFPGQGSQSVGMLADILTAEPVVRQAFDEASEALGYDMTTLVADNPDDRLNQTEFTQPALLTASTALLRLWQQRGGGHAAHAAGHSLGEYSALVAAGSLQFSDAVKLVAYRGRVMSEAVPDGVGLMAAILGLEDAVLESLCDDASEADAKVWAANYNCPGQLVVAGHVGAVERLIELAKNAGAKRALLLQVSAPSHTPLMQPAADSMRIRLRDIDISEPSIPVWSNALAAPLNDATAIREALVQQLIAPVRWSETIVNMHAAGVVAGVEMGPGKVVSGIVRRVERAMPVYATDASASMDKAIAAIAGGE
ncbi:MAG: ACP S-malonyltransferase [Mariprofundaceae bacterium]